MRNKKTNYYYVRMIMFDGSRPTLCKRNKAYIWCTWDIVKQFKDADSASIIARTKCDFANVSHAEVRYHGAVGEDTKLIASFQNPNYEYFKMLADMKKKELRRQYGLD